MRPSCLGQRLDVQIVELLFALEADGLDVEPDLEERQAPRHAHRRHALHHRQQRHLGPEQLLLTLLLIMPHIILPQ